MYTFAMKQLKVISTTEARKSFAKIADELRDGKTTYSVVRHGKELFRMVPVDNDRSIRISPKLKRELASVFRRYDGALRELANR